MYIFGYCRILILHLTMIPGVETKIDCTSDPFHRVHRIVFLSFDMLPQSSAQEMPNVRTSICFQRMRTLFELLPFS